MGGGEGGIFLLHFLSQEISKAWNHPGGRPMYFVIGGDCAKENQLGFIEIPVSEIIGLSSVFVEDTHSLCARILTELNKIKQLTAPKKSFFGDSIARLVDFVVRQHARLVYLNVKASQNGSSFTVQRAINAKRQKDAPRPEESPKEWEPSGRSGNSVSFF